MSNKKAFILVGILLIVFSFTFSIVEKYVTEPENVTVPHRVILMPNGMECSRFTGKLITCPVCGDHKSIHRDEEDLGVFYCDHCDVVFNEIED